MSIRGCELAVYEQRFVKLMRERRIERTIDRNLIDRGACLLCGDEKPHHCHQRLVAEYLKRHRGDLEIEHIRLIVETIDLRAVPSEALRRFTTRNLGRWPR